MPTPGDTICGEIVLERLASASMGAQVFQPVFSARDISRDEGLWLTLIDGMFTPTEVDLSSFMAGANGLTSLRHPSLVRVVLVDREEDYCVVGYEQLPGAEPLGELVVRGGSRRVLARAAIEVARGLAYLHRHGLVHGALTPGTVLMWEGAPMLWEYGLAGLCDRAVLGPRARTLGGDVVAPEILSGAPLNPAVDVFAWGAVIASVASGELGSDAVSALMEGDVDPGRFGLLLGVVRQALSPEPGLRPRDGVHLLELLQRSLAAVDPNTEVDEPERASGGDEALRELTQRYLGEVRGPGDGGMASGSGPGGGEVARARPVAARSRALAGRARQSASGWLRPAAPRAADGGVEGLFEARMPYEDLDHGVRKRLVLASATPRPQPPDRPPPRQAEAGAPQAPVGEDETPPGGNELLPEPAPAVRRAELGRHPPGLAELLEGDDDVLPSDRVTAPEMDILTLAPPPGADDELPPPDGLLPNAAESSPARSKPAKGAHEPFRVPRSPGPHGPPARLMAVTVAALCGLVAVASTLAAASARGGFGRLWSAEPSSLDPDAIVDEAAAGDDAGADGGPGPCPSGMVVIAAEPEPFCIDRAEYPGIDRAPAIDVDLAHAEQACTVRGHALCTEAQWDRACRGRADWRFPYGPRREAGRCRVGEESATPGNSGADPHCVTPEGVLDLVGNVAEWTAEGAVMGGSVRSDRNTSCRSRHELEAKSKTPVVGFRCCTALAGEAAAGSGA